MKIIKRVILNKLLSSLMLATCLTLFLLFTNPDSIALPVLIAPFIIIGLLIYQLTSYVIEKNRSLRNTYAARLLPLSIAGLGVALLLLRSLHQLTIKDSILVFGFAIVFWLYVWRADFLHK